MIKIENAPKSFIYCFNERCPLHEKCLRFLAGKEVPASTTWGSAVYPKAVTEEGCEKYEQYREVPLAWGFSLLFDEVKAKDIVKMRNEMKEYFGGQGAYYRYNNGTYKLCPEQQEWLSELFKRWGYTGILHFDHVELSVDFGARNKVQTEKIDGIM